MAAISVPTNRLNEQSPREVLFHPFCTPAFCSFRHHGSVSRVSVCQGKWEDFTILAPFLPPSKTHKPTKVSYPLDDQRQRDATCREGVRIRARVDQTHNIGTHNTVAGRFRDTTYPSQRVVAQSWGDTVGI